VTLPAQDLDHVAMSSGADEVETRLVVGDLLGELSPVHRDALVAVYYADRTAKAAAGVLGIPPGTVKSRIHNALRTLRATITAPPCKAA
jgi:RNA polymerase sigma-70 factor (ECF subfamily)